MPWFDVYIPSKDDDGTDITLTVEAPNWIGALRTGLSNIGEGHDAISNVMCDIQEDNSIHVTNPASSRVFKINETQAPGGAKAEAAKPSEVKTTAPRGHASIKDEGSKKSQRGKEKAPPPKRESGQFADAPQPSSRRESKSTGVTLAPSLVEDDVSVDDVIADVFDATSDLMMEGDVSPEKIAEKMLDIALDKIPAEAGTFYLADINGGELSFAAVRGPKAKEIQKKKLTVPVGQGIVGFSAQEGVCLVVNDMQHDERYFAGIADAVGYQPQNSLCASAEKDGRLYGALQLINAKRGAYTAGEMEVIRYIGLTAADMLERHFELHTEIGL